MVDFLRIATKKTKNGIDVYPKFVIKNSKDLMIRGGDFYAIWVEERGLWSTNELDAIDLIDRELDDFAVKKRATTDEDVRVLYMWDSEFGMIDSWHKYCQKQMRDSYVNLDEKLIFSNTEINKKDYASKRLSYPLEAGSISAYNQIMSTLYSEEERSKIEWAIGAIVTGDSKEIQKFMVLYGAAGTGKSTVLNIIQQLFEGYYSVFDAKALGSASSSFALEAFRTNPLVAIQHDGDLSKIEDNTRINSVVSHEEMTINEKFKSTYTNRFKCFLFMGTNKPVKITDAKSGLIRRLIDVTPTGNKLKPAEYKRLTKQVSFELGGIAYHCREVYLSDPGKYDDYIPTNMLGASNDFYNFVMDSYFTFKNEKDITLKSAWEMYKTYCDYAKVPYQYQQRIFKEELKNYFSEYKERHILEDGTRVRNYYIGFKSDKFNQGDFEDTPEDKDEPKAKVYSIKFEETESIFEMECANCPAQYATSKETPMNKWEEVVTTLSELDTSKLHYVKVPENHIVIDFDIPDENGNKCFEKNLEAASKWPETYAELSKSGSGIHLHYFYTGDISKLSRVYDDHIEIKIFTGGSSLRRKLTKCNRLPIASLSSGLPLKGEKRMVNFDAIKSEKGLRSLIKRNLNKEIHPGTKPSIDFIYKILEDAYNGDLKYDVTDMRNSVLAFAANSTHQADYCIKLVNKMRFKSEENSEGIKNEEAEIVFFDIEVFPNLFLVNWKFQGKDKPVIRMINPKPHEIEELLKFRLIGFNNLNYDNHMLYACLMGYNNEQLYKLSGRLINRDKQISRKAKFGEAFNISYTDVFDFAANKQSLKKWEIELGIHHQELGLPWDEPVPEDKWIQVAEYCDNDVIATEAVFEHLKGDWTARQILAALAGMPVNTTTNGLTTRIIFGSNRKPQDQFNYRNMGEMNLDDTFDIDDEYTRFNKKCQPVFPGYEYNEFTGKSSYRGEDPSEGGYVYAEPGIYGNVALLDVASLHPSSAILEEVFGSEFTKRFQEIRDARVLIKHKDFDAARKMLNGALAPYLTDESTAKDLAQALKIAINSVYGLTSATFPNPFKDPRNKDNIVAKRGALFMINLKHQVQAKGFTVVHIKTDSIKIADATPEIIEFVMDYGKRYGYTFEHEDTYERICLVNDAVYIAKSIDGHWTATGTQFQVPYVFKKLFSKEPIEFEDMCELKTTKVGPIYLDMNERLPDVSAEEKEHAKLWKQLNDPERLQENMTLECDRVEELSKIIETGHKYIFVGRVGQFCPVKPGANGGILYYKKDNKYYSVNGTKGYRWKESEFVRELGKEDDIDRSYYDSLVNGAVETISKFGDFEWFVSDDPYVSPPYIEQNGWMRPLYSDPLPEL
jgi:hypothetical protein|nr:MAG TPA: dsDNA helicase [Herelleviridae sp.]